MAPHPNLNKIQILNNVQKKGPDDLLLPTSPTLFPIYPTSYYAPYVFNVHTSTGPLHYFLFFFISTPRINFLYLFYFLQSTYHLLKLS